MPKIKVIINPQAGRGYAGRISPLIEREFSELGADFELVHTTTRGEAITLAREALEAGFDTLVAVGGDGTSHEVVNGMMIHANGHAAGTLGCIPAGSGNDFAVMNGAPVDVHAACAQIVAQQTRMVDIGQVTIDGCITRYFDNAVGIGFDGLVTMETRKWTRVRGMALYLPVVLKTIFVDLRPPMIEINYDGQTIRQRNLMTVIMNGSREGGSFFVAPGATTDDGAFDLVVAAAMPRLQILGFVPRFLKGTHVGDPRIIMEKARNVVVSSKDPLYLHVDGEILCEVAHRVEARMLPSTLRMIAPANG